MTSILFWIVVSQALYVYAGSASNEYSFEEGSGGGSFTNYICALGTIPEVLIVDHRTGGNSDEQHLSFGNLRKIKNKKFVQEDENKIKHYQTLQWANFDIENVIYDNW